MLFDEGNTNKDHPELLTKEEAERLSGSALLVVVRTVHALHRVGTVHHEIERRQSEQWVENEVA